ncbi:mitotic checkpoint protein BUB3 [Annulohypoxylon truncatum]|uniref:mitotic checkpoint protein BUB3 n=1 Tax=Annulohypoxylon truncatum TaxID=327061 RepID=UPI002007CB4A|nr:mitotic checkpoint protein BUB3 [Annulohypoxylon truncatum]KAI1208384.1 mitotic checkpoint protein BUB3 [Annulohypoxylon truncatum]
MAPTATQFELAQPPNDAISALAFAPDSPSRLLAASWDKNIYLYDTLQSSDDDENSHGTLLRTYEHRAPVMDVCFGRDSSEAFSAGMDWQVRHIDLETGDQSTVSKHAAPVRRVVYSREHSLLISASWDMTLHVHDPSNPSLAPLTVPLPGKPHAMAASPSKVIVAMTSRLVHIYDLSTLSSALSSQTDSAPAPWQQRESSLKFLTRAVAAMPSDAGYATSSIEGRVAVEWFDASAESQARKYAFKCHRTATPTATDGPSSTSTPSADVVYPVNALAFHPVHGSTFASGGGDATVALWDAEAKRRMKVYQKFADSVAALAFSADGRYLAVAVCPGFETGMEDYSGEGRTKIFVRELGENEALPKGKGK